MKRSELPPLAGLVPSLLICPRTLQLLSYVLLFLLKRPRLVRTSPSPKIPSSPRRTTMNSSNRLRPSSTKPNVLSSMPEMESFPHHEDPSCYDNSLRMGIFP